MALLAGLLILCFISVEGTSAVACSCCPDDWIRSGNSCYLFIGSKETWAEAHQKCAARGSTVVSIQTAEENAFIEGYLKVFAALGADVSCWIAGTDMEKEGVWKLSPAGEKLNFTDWGPGQPEGPDSAEDCLSLWGPSNYKWADAPCHKQNSFICEKPYVYEGHVKNLDFLE